jgi:hypothetical protein
MLWWIIIREWEAGILQVAVSHPAIIDQAGSFWTDSFDSVADTSSSFAVNLDCR